MNKFVTLLALTSYFSAFSMENYSSIGNSACGSQSSVQIHDTVLINAMEHYERQLSPITDSALIHASSALMGKHYRKLIKSNSEQEIMSRLETIWQQESREYVDTLKKTYMAAMNNPAALFGPHTAALSPALVDQLKNETLKNFDSNADQYKKDFFKSVEIARKARQTHQAQTKKQ